MDRVTRYNVIALSGKAVEACGDVDTMILDKTGRLEKVGLEGDELKKYIDKMVSRIDSLESVKEKV